MLRGSVDLFLVENCYFNTSSVESYGNGRLGFFKFKIFLFVCRVLLMFGCVLNWNLVFLFVLVMIWMRVLFLLCISRSMLFCKFICFNSSLRFKVMLSFFFIIRFMFFVGVVVGVVVMGILGWEGLMLKFVFIDLFSVRKFFRNWFVFGLLSSCMFFFGLVRDFWGIFGEFCWLYLFMLLLYLVLNLLFVGWLLLNELFSSSSRSRYLNSSLRSLSKLLFELLLNLFCLLKLFFCWLLKLLFCLLKLLCVLNEFCVLNLWFGSS